MVTDKLNLLSEMMSKCIKPDVVTYTCLMRGLCNFGHWKEAKTLLITHMLPLEQVVAIIILVDWFS
jgi:pentatricopeptide repeat protein